MSSPHLPGHLRQLAIVAAVVARFCDYTEHLEPADARTISTAGADLRQIALDLASGLGVDAVELYGDRLDSVERLYVLGVVDGFEAGAHVKLAETWRDLQLIQGHHDRLYRPDVSGLSRSDQLVHTCIHLAKLVGALADAKPEDVRSRVIPDVLLFGIKLATLAGETLSDQPLPGQLGAEVSRVNAELVAPDRHTERRQA